MTHSNWRSCRRAPQVSKEDGVLQPPEKMAAQIGEYLRSKGFLSGKK